MKEYIDIQKTKPTEEKESPTRDSNCIELRSKVITKQLRNQSSLKYMKANHSPSFSNIPLKVPKHSSIHFIQQNPNNGTHTSKPKKATSPQMVR